MLMADRALNNNINESSYNETTILVDMLTPKTIKLVKELTKTDSSILYCCLLNYFVCLFTVCSRVNL